jgi:ABC-type molybdate transport system substrate-binding protein
MRDGVAAAISSRNFGAKGNAGPTTLVGQHGYDQPIRQWVVVENDDQGQNATTDLTSADGVSAQAFIKYLLSAKGQAVLASFGYDPIS